MDPQFITLAIVFVAITAMVCSVYALFDPYSLRVQKRLDSLDASGPSQEASEAADVSTSPILAQFLQRFNPYDAESRNRLRDRLSAAGIYDTRALQRFFLARVVLASGIVVVAIAIFYGGWLSHNLILGSLVLLVPLGVCAPDLWLQRAIVRFRRQLNNALPDFLDLMIVCLGGGMSLQDTVRRVGDDLQIAHPTLASELRIVRRDMELGSTTDQALKRLANRSNCDGIRTLTSFIRESQKFGTNITEALKGHADMLRVQRERVAEERAQQATVKILLPTLLLIFPGIFVVLVLPAIIQIQAAFAAN